MQESQEQPQLLELPLLVQQVLLEPLAQPRKKLQIQKEPMQEWTMLSCYFSVRSMLFPSFLRIVVHTSSSICLNYRDSTLSHEIILMHSEA